MRNSWEDKFFSMLMLGENEQAAQQAQQLQANNVPSGPISDATLEAAIAEVAVSDLISPPQVSGSLSPQQSQGTLSDVSDAEAF
jgi:DNA-binding NarL/FixJ family response regulator